MPESSPVEDIRGQLLDPEASDFVFATPPRVSPATKQVVDRQVQTEAEPSGSCDRQISSPESVVRIAKALEHGFAKIVEAIDRNSRAVRELDRSMGKVSDAVARMERSVDRMATESRIAHRRAETRDVPEKRPRLEEQKENFRNVKGANDADKRSSKR